MTKCAIHHCYNKIVYARTCPKLATDYYCEGHGKAMASFMKNTEDFTWRLYDELVEEEEKIKNMKECVESGQKYERSRQIEMRDILFSDIAQKGWIEIDIVPPPSNEIVVLRDDLGSYAGFRTKDKEYRKLNTAGISIKPPIPVYWMPLPKRK